MTKLVWQWWSRGDNEDGLTGFHTKEDCEAFERGEDGPFRRRVSEDGRTTSQMWDWNDLMQSVRAIVEPKP